MRLHSAVVGVRSYPTRLRAAAITSVTETDHDARTWTRLPSWRTSAAAQPGLYDGRIADAGAGDRCEHRDLQRRRPGAAASGAVAGAGAGGSDRLGMARGQREDLGTVAGESAVLERQQPMVQRVCDRRRNPVRAHGCGRAATGFG